MHSIPLTQTNKKHADTETRRPLPHSPHRSTPHQTPQRRHPNHHKIPPKSRRNHRLRHMSSSTPHRDGPDENGPNAQIGRNLYRTGTGSCGAECGDGSGVFGYEGYGGLCYVGGWWEGSEDGGEV